MARSGWVRRGAVRLGGQGWARQGEIWKGTAWHGMAVAEWKGPARPGKPGRLRQGVEWEGGDSRGKAVMVCRGQVRTGWARRGAVRRFWRGLVSRGLVGSGTVRCGGQYTKGQRMSSRSKLEAIKVLERRGRIEPDDLIEAARDPEHPCHNDFTWDDEAAAAEYRREQARALIRTFHFEVRVEEIGAVNVVCYVPDGNSPGRMRSTASVRSQDDVTALFQTELRQLLGVAARVLGIAEAKRGVLGSAPADTIRSVCDTLKAVMVAGSEPAAAVAASEAA